MSAGTAEARRQTSVAAVLPALIFLVTISLTIGATLITRRSLDQAAQGRFDALAGSTADRLGDRFRSASAVARGTAGLFTAEGRVSPEAFHRYVGAQSVERWFSHGYVAWAVALQPGQSPSETLALGRRDYPKYAFNVENPQYPVVFVSPRDANSVKAVGVDFGSLPDRLATLELARDRGEPELLTTTLVVANGRPGIAIFYPIYVDGRPPGTLEERRAQFRGVITLSAVTDELMSVAFGPAKDIFHFEVLNRSNAGRVLWRSEGFPTITTRTGLRRAIVVGDTTLEVHVVPRESFSEPAERYAVVAMLIVGTLLAFAASGLTFQQLRARQQAEVAQAATRRALDENERRRAMLDSVVAQSSDGIVMADDAGHILIFNQAAADLLGIDCEHAPREASALQFYSVEGHEIEATQTPLFRAIRGEVVRDARWMVRRPDGEQRALSGTASPLRNADGANAGGLLVMRDETSRLRAEADRERLIAALEFSNAELDQFASVASHDLKAPLRGIAQLAQWLEDDLGEKLSAENRQHLTLLNGRVRRLVALIDGILGYARAGKSGQELESFDARVAVTEALQLLVSPAGAVITLPDEGRTIRGDKTLLVQVLMNLLSNAFKHGNPNEPTVRIAVTPEGDYLRFSVTDNGPGIAPEYHQRIWGMFQTLSPRDEKESTGVGLAVVRKVVQAQGGRTGLDSVPGHGATFFFTWPRQSS